MADPGRGLRRFERWTRDGGKRELLGAAGQMEQQMRCVPYESLLDVGQSRPNCVQESQAAMVSAHAANAALLLGRSVPCPLVKHYLADRG